MRYFSFLILLLCTLQLTAQTEQWIGINNLFFKQKTTTDEQPLQSDSTSTFFSERTDQQFSFGLSYRKVKEDGSSYYQIDIFNINQTRDKVIQGVRSPTAPLEVQSGSQEIIRFNVLAGYQMGKLLPITGGLSGDVGLRGTLGYDRAELTPLSSLSFPIEEKALGVGVNLRTGLVYRIGKKLNIAYHISVLSLNASWEESYVDNPILTERQKTSQSYNFDVLAFQSVVDFRNISINYVF
ncbi:MAG: hypothetical protein AAGJ93_16335 [Bacteroidota bacterium]